MSAAATIHADCMPGRVRTAPPVTPDRRRLRLWTLLAAIFLMSVADLCMTLTYLLEIGMLEANPIARQVMLYNSPALLVAWKLGTVLAALGLILFAGRRTRFAEVGAWLCFFVMAWLTARWYVYNAGAHQLTPYLHAFSTAENGRWVAMTR